MKKEITNKPKSVKKKAKGNTAVNKLPKYKLDNIMFFLTGAGGKANSKTIDRFADEMLEYYLAHPNARYINEFPLSKGVMRDKYYRWMQRNKHLKETHDYCMEAIGLRRENIIDDYSANNLKHKQYKYDKEFDDASRHHLKMANEESESDRDVTVIFKDYKSEPKDKR